MTVKFSILDIICEPIPKEKTLQNLLNYKTINWSIAVSPDGLQYWNYSSVERLSIQIIYTGWGELCHWGNCLEMYTKHLSERKTVHKMD